MSARTDVQSFLSQWAELSQAEAVSINAANWSEVNLIQSEKLLLQSSLSEALRLCLEGSKVVTLPADDPLRIEAARLLSLEGRNAELLEDRFRLARLEQEQLRASLRNLRKLRRSYGPNLHSGLEWIS